MTKDEEKAVVERLAAYISLNFPLIQPVEKGIPAKALIKQMSRTPHGWDKDYYFIQLKDKKRLIKRALSKLKAAGKLITEPVISKYDRRFDRELGTYVKRITGWRYKWVDNPLDAIAALHPLDKAVL